MRNLLSALIVVGMFSAQSVQAQEHQDGSLKQLVEMESARQIVTEEQYQGVQQIVKEEHPAAMEETKEKAGKAASTKDPQPQLGDRKLRSVLDLVTKDTLKESE